MSLLAWDAATTVAVYVLWKLLLRACTGSTPDARGWGLETYVSAAVHQLATTIFTCHLIYLHVRDLSDWLASTWSSDLPTPELQRYDRVFYLMQSSEMLTDMGLHYFYPGFGTTYLAHHISTFAAATAACFAGVPIGGCICFGAAMEVGGMSLNVVSLWPVLSGSKEVPAWLYTARVHTFVGSRLVATIVMARTTQLSCFTP